MGGFIKRPYVVILAGGFGLRMRNSNIMPKVLVKIGNLPIIEHIIKIYSHFGYDDFLVCTGYKKNKIERYFKNNSELGATKNIQLIDTGLNTPTGGRIKKIEKYLDGTGTFFCTYGDGLSNVNMNKLLKFHREKGKIATLTAVHPMSPFGVLSVDDNNIVTTFKEKPTLPGLINGGFFVFEKEIFDYLDFDSVLEEKPLTILANTKNLAAYVHDGFWACMDTYKDVYRLNEIWNNGAMPNTGVTFSRPPWKVWK
ncbi:MAG: sugar phosphate nucleotidyltransferase [Candidatus Micrarchaeaceae archaeon]